MSYEEDETWWDPNVVRIFDPYYDISQEDIESITEGRKNAAGDPVGQCVLQLSTGDEVYGNFRKGVRQVRDFKMIYKMISEIKVILTTLNQFINCIYLIGKRIDIWRKYGKTWSYLY